MVTDLGYVTDSIKFHLRGADLLVLESNHDLEMLKVGPYPWSVKQRVMGRKGHLSNDVVSRFHPAGSGFVHQHAGAGPFERAQQSSRDRAQPWPSSALDRAGRALFTRLVVAEPKQQTEVFTY